MSNDVDFSKLEISNAELLRGVTSSALAAMQYFIKLDAIEDQKEIAQDTTSVVNKLEMLGKEWNNELYDSVLESLEDVKTSSTNPDYNEVQQETAGDVYELGTLAVERLKGLEDAMVAGEAKITAMNNEMSLLKGNRTADSLDMIKAIGNVEAGNIQGAATTSAKRLTNRVKNITDNINYTNTLNKLDADKVLEGLQIDLSQASAEYYQKIAEEAGFGRDLEQRDETTGIVDYYLPEDMQVNVSTYKNALTWLNKWEVYQSTKGVESFEKELKHEETRVFDFVSQLGFSSNTGEQAAFGIIVDGLLGDDEDVSAQLNALSKENPELAKKATEYLSELQDLFATGKYELDFNALKTQAIGVKGDILEGRQDRFEALTEAQQEIVTEQSNAVVADIKTLDSTISMLNKMEEYKKMQLQPIAAEVEDLKKIPGRVDNLKRSHVQILNSLIDQDTGMGIFNQDVIEAASQYTAAGKQHPIKEFSLASNIRNQYKALNKLTERYIGPDGTRLKQDEVDQLFGELRSFDKEQSNVFYDLLQSFKSLDILDPLTKANVKTIGDF